MSTILNELALLSDIGPYFTQNVRPTFYIFPICKFSETQLIYIPSNKLAHLSSENSIPNFTAILPSAPGEPSLLIS